MKPSLTVTRSATAPIAVMTCPPGSPGAAMTEPLLLVGLGSVVSDVLETTLRMLVSVGGGTNLIVRLWLLPLAKVGIGKSIVPVVSL